MFSFFLLRSTSFLLCNSTVCLAEFLGRTFWNEAIYHQNEELKNIRLEANSPTNLQIPHVFLSLLQLWSWSDSEWDGSTDTFKIPPCVFTGKIIMESRPPTTDKHPHFNHKKAVLVSEESRRPSIRNKYHFRVNVEWMSEWGEGDLWMWWKHDDLWGKGHSFNTNSPGRFQEKRKTLQRKIKPAFCQ